MLELTTLIDGGSASVNVYYSRIRKCLNQLVSLNSRYINELIRSNSDNLDCSSGRFFLGHFSSGEFAAADPVNFTLDPAISEEI